MYAAHGRHAGFFEFLHDEGVELVVHHAFAVELLDALAAKTPRRRCLGLREPLEDRLELFLGNADARVLHLEMHTDAAARLLSQSLKGFFWISVSIATVSTLCGILLKEDGVKNRRR